MQTATAHEHCSDVTRQQAHNFYYGIRLLPPAKRQAMCAVYALARRIDDVGDGPLAAPAKLAALDRLREEIRAETPAETADPPVGRPEDPVFVALADAARSFPIPYEAFLGLVDGVEMDVRGTTYETFEDLVPYCQRVAGTIGRLSLSIFGSVDPGRAAPLADRLGVALQLTNVLRDLREDLVDSRCYLPAADLEGFGCALRLTEDGDVAAEGGRMLELVRFEADRAERLYAEGLGLLNLVDRRSAACCGAMAGIYHRLLRRIAANPALVLRRRVSLPGWEKALVAARCVAGAA